MDRDIDQRLYNFIQNCWNHSSKARYILII